MKSSIYSLLALAVICTGCSAYSFTGASLVNGERTISIQQFYNNALLGPSNMSQVFTEKMRDYFQQNTSLALVQDNGDLQFDGFISSFTVSPVAPNANARDGGLQTSATTRVTITVQVTYVNIKNDQFDFDQSFRFFQDFDSEATDLQSVEDQLVDEIFNQIILDIFNASVANW